MVESYKHNVKKEGMYKIMHPGQHKKTNLYFRGEYIGNNSIK
jgi:hypothetical protein